LQLFAVFLLTLSLFSMEAQAAEVAVIVNKESSQNNISINDLARIYQGKKTSWSDGSSLMAINHPTDSPIRKIFYKGVLNAEPTAQFFQTNNPIPFKTLVQQSGLAVKRLVSKMPNAIGYIAAEELDDSVKAVSIDNLVLKSKDYPLHD